MLHEAEVVKITSETAGAADAYEATVNGLFDVYLDGDRRASMAPILSLLGCCTIATTPLGECFEAATATAVEFEPFVVSALLRSLHLHVEPDGGRLYNFENALAILNGLAKKDRWRQCLESQDGALALAITLLREKTRILPLKGPIGDAKSRKLADACLDSLGTILSQWLDLDPSITIEAPIQMVVRKMFGDFWFDFSFTDKRWFNEPDTNKDNLTNLTIIRAVAIRRPPFMPHLLVGQAEAPPAVDLTLIEFE
jgi:hypothetical protein